MPELLALDDGRIVGGGQRFALRLGEGIRSARPDWRFRLACPSGTELEHRARGLGIEVAPVPFPDPVPIAAAQWPAAVHSVRTLVRRSPTDAIVLSNAVRASAVALLAGVQRRRPLVHVMHERESAGRRSVRALLPCRGSVLAVGEGTARAYRDALGPRARVDKMNNFLLGDEVDRLLAVRAERAPRPTDGLRLGVLARLIPEKGVLELVEELIACPEAWARLRVAGDAQDGRYVEAVAGRVAAAGLGDRISLQGPTDDVPGFLRETDALIVPSVGHEAQPTVLLEALAAGVPAVVRAPVWSTDFDGVPVVRYHGVDDLGAALEALPEASADERLLRDRFGVEQAIAAVERAAADR